MRALTLLCVAFLLPAVAAAQSAPPPPLPPPEPPPPVAPSSVPPTPEVEPFPDKVELPPSPESAPTVNIRRLESGDVVEEYRTGGRLYEVRVRPQNGVPYALLDTNGDGRLDRRDSEGPVAPVYYTLYEWN